MTPCAYTFNQPMIMVKLIVAQDCAVSAFIFGCMYTVLGENKADFS